MNLLPILFLATPHERIGALVEELDGPLDLGPVCYERPQEALRPYQAFIERLEDLKNTTPLREIILSPEGERLDPVESLQLRLAQDILEAELERINSRLCAPRGCALCCVGPETGAAHSFFEIPLSPREIDLFPLPRLDTDRSRTLSPHDEGFDLPGDGEAPFLGRWRTGWGLVLPRGSHCPNLDGGLRCRVYGNRPTVCRKPQIFAYVLERTPEHDLPAGGSTLPSFVARRTILAVWDCPYVRDLRQEIIDFAEACGLEPVFRENKR